MFMCTDVQGQVVLHRAGSMSALIFFMITKTFKPSDYANWKTK